MRGLLLAAALASLAGCALEAGGPFATVEPTFEARYAALADRDAGEGFQKLASDYQVRLTRAELGIDTIGLLQGGTGETASFDPANPPEGYGLCHGGHCHRDDGALVSYEEIAAELAGGSDGLTAALALPVGARDLLAAGRTALGCEPSCELSMGTLRRAELRASRLVLEGVVRDGRAEARLAPRSFRLDTPVDAGAEGLIAAVLKLPADGDSPPRVSLGLTLELTAKLFDPVDWAAAQVEGEWIDLGAGPNQQLREQLLARLAQGELTAQITRSED